MAENTNRFGYSVKGQAEIETTIRQKQTGFTTANLPMYLNRSDVMNHSLLPWRAVVKGETAGVDSAALWVESVTIVMMGMGL